MEKDLKSMSRKDLEKLLSDVKKALQAAQARERRAARKAAQKAAAEYGFSLNDLAEETPAPKKQKKPRKSAAGPKSKPQFANPDDAKQTWTGKGRQPNWFRAQVENGVDPETMRI
ncbi:H-NS family nucleoid-associated regulatory protein [Sulfitobacter sp. PS-8MA]|uniref:H-NS histone family protein n=1 Tax=Sulfitobacter sp. PS-8MA TaxID=3237707 RepID=UPI0034C6AF3E